MAQSKGSNNKKLTGRNVQSAHRDQIEHDERMVPEYHKGYELYGEHIARYQATLPLVKNKTVLDVASGSGYGTKMIAQAARKVYGVDISQEAIKYSQKYYSAANIEYLVGDGSKLPLEDGKVDVVTSFETIEHIADYKTFLSETKRVLKPEGLLVVSTPNDLEFIPGNHFHLHQFTEQELKQLLRKYYKYVEPYYQTTWVFNFIGNGNSLSREWTQHIPVTQTLTIPNEKVLYFYFLCSDKPLDQVVVEPVGAIGEHWSERSIHEKDQLTQNHIRNLEEMERGHKKYIHKLENDIESIQDELKAVGDELAAIKKSPAFRLSRKLRKKPR